MDLELSFDFDSKQNETIARGKRKTKKANSKKNDPDDNDNNYNSRRKCSNSNAPGTGKLDFAFNGTINDHRQNVLNDPKRDALKTMSLSRSQKQNNIPSTLGTYKTSHLNSRGKTARDISYPFEDKNNILHDQGVLFAQLSNSKLDENTPPKARPLSARQAQIALREKTNPKTNRARPKSHDFSLVWNPVNEQSESRQKRLSSAKRKSTMYTLENYAEFIV